MSEKIKQANTRWRGAAGFMKPCVHLPSLDANWLLTRAKTASLGLSCLGHADRRAADILAYFACFLYNFSLLDTTTLTR